VDFEEVAESLATIANTGSTLQKEYLLRKYGSEIEGFKDVLKFIYDPYFTTGLGQKKLDRVDFNATRDITAEEIMSYLHRCSTGTDYDAAMANTFIYMEPDSNIWQWAATGLVTKDLQIGVSVTTLNKVYGAGFIAKIGIMRGMLCPETARGIYVATEKIDGNRRIIMNKESGVEIYTRSGHRERGLREIEEQVQYLPKGQVYDTECVAVGDYADNIELRQASASILNSHSRNKTGVKALCFDMLSQAEYDAGQSKMAAVFRKYMIAFMYHDIIGMDMLDTIITASQREAILKHCNDALPQYACTKNIQGLPILGIAHNKEEGKQLAEPIWETGGEGVMLVEYRSPYEVNPNPRKTLLKIKATQEFTCKCINVLEGDNKYQGMLGAIEVLYDRKGDPHRYSVKVGSGFPDYLRVEYWTHPERIIGKMVEIESFGESRNAQGVYSLNCPIFKRIVGEKE